MLKRKWLGEPTCYFCDQDESVSHLFQCSVAKVVWAIIATSVGADNVPSLLNNASYGVKLGFPMGNSFTLLALQPCAGPFGK